MFSRLLLIISTITYQILFYRAICQSENATLLFEKSTISHNNFIRNACLDDSRDT